jgi:hypothetical protein
VDWGCVNGLRRNRTAGIGAIAIILLLSGDGCSGNRRSSSNVEDPHKEEHLKGSEAITDHARETAPVSPLSFGELRLATLDYLTRNPRAVTRGHDVLTEQLADKSSDSTVVAGRISYVNGWTVDLPGGMMEKSVGNGPGQVEIYDFYVNFGSFRPVPVVREVRVVVEWAAGRGRQK